INGAHPATTAPDDGVVKTGTLASGSAIVTGVNTSGLFVGEAVTGTGIPIPTLPSSLTAGNPETITRITAIDSINNKITLSANATANGSQSLTFITGQALDGSGMRFVSTAIDNTTTFTQTYTYNASTYANPN